MPRKAPSAAFPWRGFERPPEGCLFEQLVDLGAPMGVAYERSLRFHKPEHIHDRVLFVLPRAGSAMRLRFGETSALVTSADAAVVPANVPHADDWETDVYDTLALLPSPALLATLGEGARAPDGPAVFRRSAWLEALVDEYFAERVLRGTPDGPRHAPLAELLLRELLRLAREAEVPAETRGLRPGPSSAIARALRHVEAHLFVDVDLDGLARASAMSRSSLLRAFRRELGTTPKAYVIGRRLEEAKRLLETGRHHVGEVARLVGYENPGAFSEAFRRRFGAPPSAVCDSRRRG